MPDRITSLQVFQRVASLGSLSAAARTLGMSQTMATKHLAALEAQLGARLVHRSTRRLTLTEPGRTYLEAIERILADLQEADAAATAATIDVRGTLRVSVPVSFGLSAIAAVLPGLARAHPALTVELGLNDRQVDLIEEGWDLAVRIGTLTGATLTARRLAPCRMLVAAAPDYLARHGTPHTLADLARHNCLGYTLSRTVGAESWAFGRDGQTVVSVSGTLKANNGDVLVAAAIAGLGLVYQPAFLVEAPLRDGRLVRLELDEPAHELAGIFAVYPTGRHPPAKVRAFVDVLAAALGPVPPWERTNRRQPSRVSSPPTVSVPRTRPSAERKAPRE